MFAFLIWLYLPIEVLANCAVSINSDLGKPQPLILNLNYTIKYPQSGDNLLFKTKENFALSCPGSHLQVVSDTRKLNFSDFETAECVSNKQFRVRDVTAHFFEITCSQLPVHLARSTGKTCEEGHQEIEIGFEISSTFMRHMKICFNRRNHTTVYSHIRQIPFIGGAQKGFARSPWANDNFYCFGDKSTSRYSNADALFDKKKQTATLSKLIGHNTTKTNPYINFKKELYLSRGHLVAKADFVYGAQQRATFHMVNEAPQWQVFNGGNWLRAEADVRNLASNYNLTLEVYTGTYGVMTLPHMRTGKEIGIYLYTSKDYRQFPVPLLFWKYLYEPVQKAGIVLIGVNNPYIKNVSKAIICKDVFSSINWPTTFTRHDIRNGYMYACTPNDFRKTVTYMPNLPVSDLLTVNSIDDDSYYSYNINSGSERTSTRNYYVKFLGVVYLLIYATK